MTKKTNFANPFGIRRTLLLTCTAILVALSTVLNIFEINFGGGAFKLSLSYLPCFIAGMYLGPIPGFAVGLLGDVLGILIAPQGPWVPLITLSSTLLGLIPGLIFMLKKVNPFIKLAISVLACFFICTMGINTAGIYLAFIKGKKAFGVYWVSRIATQSPVVGINATILALIYYPLDKFVFGKFRDNHIVTDEELEKLASTTIIENTSLDSLDYEDNVILSAEPQDNEQDKNHKK